MEPKNIIHFLKAINWISLNLKASSLRKATTETTTTTTKKVHTGKIFIYIYMKKEKKTCIQNI